jgi:beta-glucanase (GH16 family)
MNVAWTVCGVVVLVLAPLAVLADPPPVSAPEHGAVLARAPARSLIWADEFGGRAGMSPDRRKWSFDTGVGWGNGKELQAYTRRAANASLDGHGHLAITARREQYTGPGGITSGYTSARLNTRGKFAFAYGRVAARIRVPAGAGLGPAFWALGRNIGSVGWPASGEIDVMEVTARQPAVVYGTLHGPGVGGEDYPLRVNRRMPAPLANAFHVYGISWSPGRVVFTVDGRRYGVLTRRNWPHALPWAFDHPFFLLLNLAVGGDASEGPPNASTPFPATMLVDWVRVWRVSETFCPTLVARHIGRCSTRPPKRDRSAEPPRSAR